MTDDQIAEEAKRRYPYDGNMTESRINKLSSKRRRFIEGAKWMRDGLVKAKPVKIKHKDDGVYGPPKDHPLTCECIFCYP